MKNTVITVESLEKISQKEKIPFVNLLVRQGRHYVLGKILNNGLKDALWLKKRLDTEETDAGLVFFPAKGTREELENKVIELFQKEEKTGISVVFLEKENRNLPFSVETKNRIMLQIVLEKYRIPFFIEIEPNKDITVYPVEEISEGLSYYRFPLEEYLAQGFYEILDKLELLNDLSWYKEIYNILLAESVEGRKVRDCFVRHLEEREIPSLEKRLNTLKSYENYGYMKKKWKNEKKRQAGEFPEWNEVIALLTTFFSPVFDAVIKNEIFFEDWMPQLGRYL